ncbi:ABC transporter ATP-binding protein [Bradyrhizobium diazoefficiens]|nr:ABC transporter ATP-binding protein [Bradyrhizobium diazoefficiens]MBR0774557.1 ABC transporter ATP-binding protein [Bradyrhizobium diazoefficiens]
MSSDVSVRVEHLSKYYQIYDSPRDRLKQFVLPRLQSLTGREPRHYFREFWALKDVSLEVRKGETVGIIGRNGSGKSTLLQAICGTLNPTFGKIQTTGKIAALLELGSGFNPEFTGRENVYLNAAILGLSQHEIDACFDEIAAFADIGDFIEQPVKSYSSGMVVRLAFAVQAMINPDILVVDEALAVGDERFQRKCFARLEELKAKGTSILFVSHSASAVIELCDRAFLLDSGFRLMQGRPADVVRAYQRLLYAPPEEQKLLVQEYSAAADAGEVAGYRNATEEKSAPAKNNSASFDPGLVPTTTTVYPVQGAEILSIAILDQGSRVVNVLNPNEIYQIEVTGRFLKDLSGVYFGVHIRTISGAVITGQRHPHDGTHIRNVRAGAGFRIRFSFRMGLFNEAYFVGGGIWSQEEPNCAHRIIDALMFRLAQTDPSGSFGYADLMSSEPSLEWVEQ